MVGGPPFLEAQGPVVLKKGEQSLRAKRQRAMGDNPPTVEPLAHGTHCTSQERKWRPGGIQTAEPTAEGGRIGQAIGVFDRWCRRLPRTAFQEIAPQRLAAGDEAVVAVWRRERWQERESLAAKIAQASPNRNPIVVFVVSLFATAAMPDNRVLFTKRAAPQDSVARDSGWIAFQPLFLRGRWDKKNRGSGARLGRCLCQARKSEAERSPAQEISTGKNNEHPRLQPF
jgi:hypothetical protein